MPDTTARCRCTSDFCCRKKSPDLIGAREVNSIITCSDAERAHCAVVALRSFSLLRSSTPATLHSPLCRRTLHASLNFVAHLFQVHEVAHTPCSARGIRLLSRSRAPRPPTRSPVAPAPVCRLYPRTPRCLRRGGDRLYEETCAGRADHDSLLGARALAQRHTPVR